MSSKPMDLACRLTLMVAIAVVITLCPMLADLAHAQGSGWLGVNTGFSCSGGSPNGTLYTGECSGNPAEGEIFSAFVCEFEKIIKDVLSQVYCAIVDELRAPINAGLTLLVTLFGVAFLMGVSPFTAKELAILAAKFTLVMAFALEAEYMIGIGYALFMSIAKEGIVIVLSYLFEGESFQSGTDVYRMFDRVLAEIFEVVSQSTKDSNKCDNAIMALLVLTAAAIPPVFFIGVYFLFRMVWIMLRAVFGYCQGILGVTFLTTLAPIYVGFALFKPTRTLFDKWLQYLMSFSFQMVIVFAFLGMVFSILKNSSEEFQSYADIVKPYNAQQTSAGFASPMSVCGVCELNKVGPKDPPSCKSNKVLKPTELVKDENFLHFASVKLFAMIILFYILDIMMDFVPQMARYLAGPKYAGQIGGGSTGGLDEVDVSMPGEKQMNAASAGFIEGFKGSGTTPGGVVNGFLQASEYLVLGSPAGASGRKQYQGIVDAAAPMAAAAGAVLAAGKLEGQDTVVRTPVRGTDSRRADDNISGGSGTNVAAGGAGNDDLGGPGNAAAAQSQTNMQLAAAQQRAQNQSSVAARNNVVQAIRDVKAAAAGTAVSSEVMSTAITNSLQGVEAADAKAALAEVLSTDLELDEDDRENIRFIMSQMI